MTVEPLRPDDPQHIGPFTLIGYVGSGGYGTVYVGHRPGREQKVAVKKIGLVNPDAKWRQRLKLEVEAIRRVGEEFTAAFVDADVEGDEPWLATRYIPSPTLHRVVQEHSPFTERGAWWLTASLAEALFAIHAQNLLHRDLKPANVLMTADRVKVIDFGLAKAVAAAGTAEITTQAMHAGTKYYGAPEQFEDIRTATAKSDVYSLAATVVYALTKRNPHRTMAEWLNGGAPDLGGVPLSFHTLLGACLAKDPDHRPTVTDVLSQATQQLLDAGVALFTGESLLETATTVPAEDPIVALFPVPAEESVGAATPRGSAGPPPIADGPFDSFGSEDGDELVVEPSAYELVAVSVGAPTGSGKPSSGSAWAEHWQSRLDSSWDRYDG